MLCTAHRHRPLECVALAWKPQEGPKDWKKFNLDWNFQSRLKTSISLEIFNPDLQNSPQKKRGLVRAVHVAAWRCQSLCPAARGLGPLGHKERRESITRHKGKREREREREKKKKKKEKRHRPSWGVNRNNRKGGTASLRSRTCVKRNAVFGARFKGLSLYFLCQRGNLIRIKTGLDTYIWYVSRPVPPCHGTPLMIILS